MLSLVPACRRLLVPCCEDDVANAELKVQADTSKVHVSLTSRFQPLLGIAENEGNHEEDSESEAITRILMGVQGIPGQQPLHSLVVPISRPLGAATIAVRPSGCNVALPGGASSGLGQCGGPGNEAKHCSACAGKGCAACREVAGGVQGHSREELTKRYVHTARPEDEHTPRLPKQVLKASPRGPAFPTFGDAQGDAGKAKPDHQPEKDEQGPSVSATPVASAAPNGVVLATPRSSQAFDCQDEEAPIDFRGHEAHLMTSSVGRGITDVGVQSELLKAEALAPLQEEELLRPLQTARKAASSQKPPNTDQYRNSAPSVNGVWNDRFAGDGGFYEVGTLKDAEDDYFSAPKKPGAANLEEDDIHGIVSSV